MNLANFRFETDADGIALITWDMPGRSMNVLNPEVITEIDAFVAEVMALLAAGAGPEILVERVKPMRGAEARGEFAQVFGMVNPG